MISMGISRLVQVTVQVRMNMDVWSLDIGSWLVWKVVFTSNRQVCPRVRETVLSLLYGGVTSLGWPVRMMLKPVRYRFPFTVLALFFSLCCVCVAWSILTCPVNEGNWVNLQKVPFRNHTTHWLESHSTEEETECCYCHWQQEVTQNQSGSYWKQPLWHNNV